MNERQEYIIWAANVMLEPFALQITELGLVCKASDEKSYLLDIGVDSALKFVGIDIEYKNIHNSSPIMLLDLVLNASKFNKNCFLKTKEVNNRLVKLTLSRIRNKESIIKNNYYYPINQKIYRVIIMSNFSFDPLDPGVFITMEAYKKSYIKNKFNGTLIKDWTGLKDKALGDVINKYVDEHSKDRLFFEYITVTPILKIKDSIKAIL